MSVRSAAAVRTPQKIQRELEDLQLVMKARNGNQAALDALMKRYQSFVRLKSSSYFLAGGDSEDLIQEGIDRKSTRLNSSHTDISRMPSSA